MNNSSYFVPDYILLSEDGVSEGKFAWVKITCLYLAEFLYFVGVSNMAETSNDDKYPMANLL